MFLLCILPTYFTFTFFPYLITFIFNHSVIFTYLNGPVPTSFFFIFVFSIQLTENKNCRWLDSNRGSLVSVYKLCHNHCPFSPFYTSLFLSISFCTTDVPILRSSLSCSNCTSFSLLYKLYFSLFRHFQMCLIFLRIFTKEKSKSPNIDNFFSKSKLNELVCRKLDLFLLSK